MSDSTSSTDSGPPTASNGPADPAAPPRAGRLRRLIAPSAALLLLAVAGSTFTACSPIYVIRAGIAEAKILAGRRPLVEVIADPATDPGTRNTLILVREARAFAIEKFGLNAGDSYTSFTQLESDTLALVLSAAYQDRLQARTWWFPIVGHVPYRGFFDEDDALEEQLDLERDGYDTWLRPTSAFSTLGWFADPLLSSMLYADEVEVVETVLHELSHNHLFVPGRVRFNESFATFIGRTAVTEFFCTRDGGGPNTLKCLRAQARWRDAQKFSAFLDVVVDDLQAIYGDSATTSVEKVAGREAVFEQARTRFADEVQTDFESLTFASFLSTPLNNATLLSRMRYYHRLGDFEALREREGGVRQVLEYLTAGAKAGGDPFDLLPGNSRGPSGG